MRKTLQLLVATASVALLLLAAPVTGGSTPVAATDDQYQLCGRVFSDPHAYWPAESQAPGRSPFAKGSAVCAATDFLSYDGMVAGVDYLEKLFPGYVQFYKLERDFGDGSDCTSSTSNADLCSAGLPQNGPEGPTRERSDLYLLRVTDESVSDKGKKFFVFPLAIHGIERAGAEAGVRAAEDLATWAACESGTAPAIVECAQEGTPHKLLETQPGSSVTAGDALKRSSIWFMFGNPDGWRRGDLDNGVRFYQRYNGNGVDMNRDWPTVGFTFAPYTPWSEPETKGFGKVLKSIRPKWDGGIDLHGQLIDRAFSFTLLGAGQQDYAKNQRILQTVKGAWADAEARLAWSPVIKPNTAPKDDRRMYGVQWGTVWDTIGYTTTGSLGDWINSPLGLDGDGIDNEMSFSHIINCGVGSCYLPDFEQLHVDGNKSLIYSMVNFSLQPEDTTFRVPGKVGYVLSPRVLKEKGDTTSRQPGKGFPPQDAIMDVKLNELNAFTYEFHVKGFKDKVRNGGLEGKATANNVAGVTTMRDSTALVLERYRPEEETPQEDNGCGEAGDAWGTVNGYFNQSSLYFQAGMAVHSNMPLPGRYRICLAGSILGSGGEIDLDITFSSESAWEDPGQLGYEVSNMEFFEHLARHMEAGQLVALNADDVLTGRVDLDQFASLVVADDAFPGFSEPAPTGDAQPAVEFDDAEVATRTGATVPCAWPTVDGGTIPPTCVADFEFDVDPNREFNNQSMSVILSADLSIDWDLYVERQSSLNGEWFPVASSATGAASETATLLKPVPGHYRARVLNWAAGTPALDLRVTFSNVAVGETAAGTRTDAERDAWAQKLRGYAERGGNLVLTDGAVRNVAWMGLVERRFVHDFSVYAGYVGFTDGRLVDGAVRDTYGHPLAKDVNQPGAAEGEQFRHQTYEPVPIGYAISPPDEDVQLATAPVWTVDQEPWEKAGGTVVGLTTPDQVSFGELPVGQGRVRVIGALLPMPTDDYYHPFGLESYALTYTGYQLLNNALQTQ